MPVDTLRAAVHVLVFSWMYPPYLAAGASRLGQLTKYLVRAGLRVSIVTGRPRDLPVGTDIEAGAEVHYAGHLELNAFPQLVLGRDAVLRHGYEFSRLGRLRSLGRMYKQFVHLPDAQAGWIVPAARLAGRLERPDVVFSSSPPASAHVAAALYALQRGIPWVAEYRSPWSDSPHFVRWGPLRVLERTLERRIGTRASAVTAISRHLAGTLEATLGRRIEHVPNGYDPEEFREHVSVEPGLFVHLGSVYAAYPTELLLEALPAVRRAHRVVFLGRNLANLPDKIRARRADGLVEMPGPVRRRDAIQLTRRAEMNIVFLTHGFPGHPGYTREYTDVPLKMYEYFAAERPILAIGPERSETGEVLRESGLATFAENADQVARALERPPRSSIDAAWRAQFAYDRIADRVIEIFRSAVSGAQR